MPVSIHDIPSAIFCFSDDGRLQEVNREARDLLKYSEEELLGRNIEDFLSLPSRIYFQTHFLFQLHLKGAVWEAMIVFRDKEGGDVPFLVNGRRAGTSGQMLTVCSCITIHQRKKFEDEILSAKRQAQAALNENAALKQAQEELRRHAEALDHKIAELQLSNEELREYNTVISHDLQEPLRKISMLSDILQLKVKETDFEQAVVTSQKMQAVSRTMRNLILGVQEYNWLGLGVETISLVDLNTVLLLVQQKVAAEFKEVSFSLSADNLPVVEGYQQQLALLFYHLFSNAIKFRSRERELVITIKTTLLQRNRFKSLAGRYKYSDYVRITFSDNGEGFNQEYGENIFGLFRKLSPSTPGPGIGLAVVKKIIGIHKGEISVRAKEGQGASFRLLLPLRQTS